MWQRVTIALSVLVFGIWSAVGGLHSPATGQEEPLGRDEEQQILSPEPVRV